MKMQIPSIKRRLSNLEYDFRKLHKEFRELQTKGTGEPRFITLKQASVMYGLAPTTLRFRCQAGEFKGIAIRDKGRWLLNVQLFENYLASREK